MNHPDRAAVLYHAAHELAAAHRTGRPVPPVVERVPDLTLDEAYEIQKAQTRDRVDAGARVRGHKVGLTSAAMQRALGVDSPDFGALFDDMFHGHLEPIPVGQFLQPRVEPEIAVVLGESLRGPGVTVAEAFRAVQWVVPALEIIDSRIEDWRIGLLDTVADNASSGAVVLGTHMIRPDVRDLRLVGCNLSRNGRIVETGAGGAVLGSPLAALVWLANTLGRRGTTLEAGEVVLPGACTTAIPVGAGDVVSARFAGLGEVTAVFAGSHTSEGTENDD